MRRVVVTGMGVVSPLGIGVDPFWAALCRGESGIRRIMRLDPSPFPNQVAGEVLGFDPLDHLPRRDVVRTERFVRSRPRPPSPAPGWSTTCGWIPSTRSSWLSRSRGSSALP